MKHKILTFLLLMAGAIGLQSCDDEKNISADKLPQPAKEFVSQYFPSQTITRVQQERNDGRKSYEVMLDNGASIDFDNAGSWLNLDSKFSPLPLGFLPQPLQDDLAQRYPGATAHEIDKELGGYEINLNNGWDLYYTTDGTFVRQEQER